MNMSTAVINWRGEKIPALLLANRNAFYYALDRRTGKFIYAKLLVKQTWLKSFDEKGRPAADPKAEPSEAGSLVWP